MAKLSKPFYLISVAGVPALGVILPIAFVVVLVAAPEHLVKPYAALAYSVITLSPIIAFLYAAAVWFVLWYKAWEAIDEPTWNIKPLKTVLFLLIPYFNLYWVFRAYWGWAKTYNDHVFKRNTPELQVNANAFLIYSIAHPAAFFLSFAASVFIGLAEPSSSIVFPCQGTTLLLGLGFWIFNWYIAAKVCDAVNRLPVFPDEPAAEGVPETAPPAPPPPPTAR